MPAKAPEVFVPYSKLRDYGVAYSRVHLMNLVRAGRFPAPRRLSPNRVGWLASELESWIRSRPAAVGTAECS